MKAIRFTLILSTFLIMVAAILNLLNSSEAATPDRTPVYLELVVMFLLMVCVVLLNGVEKKIKKLSANAPNTKNNGQFFSDDTIQEIDTNQENR